MQRHRRLCAGLLLVVGCSAQTANPPRALTWQETVDRFESTNPTLLAGRVTIGEARADEITAYLRPNPNASFSLDQLTFFSSNPNYRPLAYSYAYGTFDYLHERRHKRELRLQSAQNATQIAIAAQDDLERSLRFSLRDAFVRLMQAKAIAAVAQENLTFYDRQIEVNRERFTVGAIAKVDFQRVQLQRVQFQSDLLTAQVNVRTAKIDLQALLEDRSPVDQFDIQANFEFSEPANTLEDLRRTALESRPDLRQAVRTAEKAKTDHRLAIANGSTDPTFGLFISHQPPPFNTYVGLSVSIPLRIFDRGQGDKLHTNLDIGRTERMQLAAETTVLHDVDAAYATVQSTLSLLRPYKTLYLPEASDIRSTISFSYEHGAASLLDFLDAQSQYRVTQVNYLTLVGSYFSAANQLNMAVGREVIQ